MGAGDDAADWEPWFVIATIVFLFAALVTGWKTPDMAAFMALCIVWNAGIIDTPDAVSGFTNTGVLAVGVLFVVVQAVERSQLALVMARQAFGMNTGVRFGLARLCTLCFAISGFLNNTPVVALLTPITRDWARTRGFSPSTFLIPLSYSTIFGGLLTVVGTSTNLVVMGLAEDMGLKIPGFFDIALVGFPVGCIGVLYLVAVGPLLLPKTGGLFRYAADNQKELVTEVQVTKAFKYLGQPVGLALAMLGLHRDCLVKIRRRRTRKVHIPLPRAGSTDSLAALNDSSRSLPESQEAGGTVGTSTAASQHATPAVSTADGSEAEGSRHKSSMEVLKGGVQVEEVMAGLDGDGEGGAAGARGRASGERRKVQGGCSKKVMFHGCDAERREGAAAAAGEGAGKQRAYSRGEFVDLYPVSMNELLQEDDVLFMSGGRTTFMALHNSISNGVGLTILEGSGALAVEGMEFVEVVLSQRNPFVGDIVAASSLGQHYGISILAIRQKGTQTEQVACVEPAQQHLERRLSIERFSFDRMRLSLDGLKRSPRSPQMRPFGSPDYARMGVLHRRSAPTSPRRSATTSPALQPNDKKGKLPSSMFPGFDVADEDVVVDSVPPLPLAKAKSEPLGTLRSQGRGEQAEEEEAAAAAAGVAGAASAEGAREDGSESEAGTTVGEGVLMSKRNGGPAAPSEGPKGEGEREGEAGEGGEGGEGEGEERSSSDEEGKGDVEVGKSKLFSGDVVLALAPEGFAEKWADKDDFLMVSTIGNVPKPIQYWDYVPVAIFAGMISWVAADPNTSMVQAAMAAAALNVMGGWVDAKLAVSYIPWDLMILIGSMLGVSRSIANSGLADSIANGVKSAGFGPQAALFFIYAVTNIMTELTTNNAAAGLIFPIAVQIAGKLEVSYMPFVFAVMCAASASFMTPIGYQTNMMVWGPGGYKFLDFTKIGAPLSAIYMVCCCVLIPLIWKFDDGPMLEE